MWQPSFIKNLGKTQPGAQDYPRAVAKEIRPVYQNSIDAFTQLMAGGHPASASNISARLGCMANGIQCCNVRVEFGRGDEYHIAAYGKEAEELYREAIMRSAERKIAVPH